MADQIEGIEADYNAYPGLQHMADIVVSVAPEPLTHIETAVARYVKPGGKVDILLSRDTSQHFWPSAPLEVYISDW